MVSPSAHIGVDIGGTKVMAVAVEEGASLGDLPRPVVTVTPASPGELVAAVLDSIDEAVQTARVMPAAIGLGVAGYVDLGGIARHAPNLRPAVGLDLGSVVSSKVGVPVRVDNDVNCAARAALHLDAPDARSLAMITLGTGIGGALVVDGEIVRGARGYAGEFGHMIVEPDGPRCVCGQKGCWERRASGSGLAALAREAVEAGSGASLLEAAGRPDDVSGPLVTTLAAAGDPQALAILDDFAGWVARGILNVVNMFDPEIVVLGGGLTVEGERLMGPIRDSFSSLVSGGAPGPPPIVVSSAGPAAGAVGAAILAGAVPHDR